MTAVETGTPVAPVAERALPYVGPRSLHEGEPIYGRGREIKGLRGTILSERIVLLYSQSGAGKTSIIEAGLRPELARRRFQMLPTIRVGYPPPMEARGVNRYRLSVLFSLEEGRHIERQFAPQELEEVSLKDYLGHRAAEEPDLDPCLIFDQFEEVFTLDPADWGEKEAFLHELGDALHDRGFFALFAMREDFIAQLDPYRDLMPTRFGNRFRLDLLGPAAAKDAIKLPAEAAGVEFTDEAADRLIDDLRRIRVQRGSTSSLELGPSVEPVQLQVVCSRVWANLSPGATSIEPKDIAAAGSVNQALAEFYAQEVRTVASRTRIKERVIREWFEDQLITEDGFRTQTREGPGRSGPAVLDGLENAHLIRADRRRGALWYELTHDRFVEPIRVSNAFYRAHRRKRNTRRAVITAAVAAVALFAVLVAALANTAEPAAAVTSVKEVFTLEVDDVGTASFTDGVVGEELTVIVNSEPATGVDVALVHIDPDSADSTLVAPLVNNVAADRATSDLSGERGDAPVVGRVSVGYVLPSDGSYAIEVSADERATLTVEYSRSSGRELVDNEPVGGSLDSPGDVGTFVFSGDAGESVVVLLEPEASFDGALTLLDEQGTQLQFADQGAAGASERIIVNLRTSGIYSVDVSGFGGSTGSFVVSVRPPEVVSIEIGDTQTGTIAGNRESEVFAFEAPQGQVVAITVVPSDAGLDPVIEVVDPSGIRQTRDATLGGETEEVLIYSSGGSHLVHVTGFDGTTGSYTLQLAPLDAAEMQIGQAVAGFVTPDDIFVYRFEAMAGEVYSILDNPTQILRYEIFAPHGYPVISSTFVAPFDGVYLLTLGSPEPTEFELAVAFAELVEIGFGESVSGSAGQFGEIPAYVFSVAEGATYTITLTPEWDAEEPWLVVTASDGFIETLVPGAGQDEVTVAGVVPFEGPYLISWADQVPTGRYELRLDP